MSHSKYHKATKLLALALSFLACQGSLAKSDSNYPILETTTTMFQPHLNYNTSNYFVSVGNQALLNTPQNLKSLLVVGLQENEPDVLTSTRFSAEKDHSDRQTYTNDYHYRLWSCRMRRTC